MSEVPNAAPEVTTPEAEAPKPQPPAAAAPQGRNDQQEPDWQNRFEAQRKASQDLEAKFNDLRNGLKVALGIEDKQKVDGNELVTTLQQQVAAMQRDTAVERVARSHGITDDTDVDLLRNAKDEATMLRLAERLKASTTPSSPAPDPSQGSAPISEEAALDAAYAAFFPDTPSK
jgi:hypothetical protein